MPLKTSVTLPRVDPIVPTARTQPFSGHDWLFEPKYDGFRGLLYLTRQSCVLYSKRGNVMRRFQSIADQVRTELPRREAILDGEIVAIDNEGRIDFWGLMRGRGTLAYAAFDVLWVNGRDLRELPLTRRKKRLERLIPASVGALNRIPCFENDGCELFEAACGWTWRGSWRSGRRTHTGRRPTGIRSRTQPTPKRRGGGNSLSGDPTSSDPATDSVISSPIDEKVLRKLVNASGFPFQLRIEHEVRRTQGLHGWAVVGQEVPWRHGLTEITGFADLVLEQGIMRLVLECKRIAEPGAYVFLVPSTDHGPQGSMNRVVCYSARSGRGINFVSGWAETSVLPASAEAAFAIVSKERPPLERLGAELTIAVEALAFEGLQIHASEEHGRTWVYFPLLVTTAPLYICHFSPGDITLSKGYLEAGRFEQIPLVRFRKALSTDTVSSSVRGLTEALAAKQRTLLVVHASQIVPLLQQWRMPGKPNLTGL
jgi:hypothetical protein